MYCPSCGTENADHNLHCTRCGVALTAAAPAAPPQAAATTPSTPEGVLETLIPYKNGAALTAYYLGIFSLVCGFLLGIPALILGIRGLHHAALHPEAKGKVHAWVGIILGSLTTLVTLGIAAAILLSAARH